MATSVPQVKPFNELLYRVGQLFEHAAGCKRYAPEIYAECLQLIRKLYEEEMKPRANLGQMDRARLDAIGRELEKLEAKQ